MHIDVYILIGSAIVGLLVGATGAGGGALMTPMLILIFGVSPAAAISSDLVASLVMRPIGAAVHLRAGTVHRRMVLLIATGAVPAAVGGACLLSVIGSGGLGVTTVERILGIALLLGSAAMLLRILLDRRWERDRDAVIQEIVPRPLLTVLIGATGGLVVGMTSVGAGSLMVVMLLFAYPSIGAKELVGTDLAQAVPLTLSAALGALIFGHVQLGLTSSLVIGATPAVFVGSLISSRVPDRLIRPVIALVILASGLKYVGVGAIPMALLMSVLPLAGVGRAVGRLRAARPTRELTRKTAFSSSGLE